MFLLRSWNFYLNVTLQPKPSHNFVIRFNEYKCSIQKEGFFERKKHVRSSVHDIPEFTHPFFIAWLSHMNCPCHTKFQIQKRSIHCGFRQKNCISDALHRYNMTWGGSTQSHDTAQSQDLNGVRPQLKDRDACLFNVANLRWRVFVSVLTGMIHNFWGGGLLTTYLSNFIFSLCEFFFLWVIWLKQHFKFWVALMDVNIWRL